MTKRSLLARSVGTAAGAATVVPFLVPTFVFSLDHLSAILPVSRDDGIQPSVRGRQYWEKRTSLYMASCAATIRRPTTE